MARAAGNTAPEALGLKQAVPWALAAVFGALATVLFHPMIGLPVAGAALAALAYGRRGAASAVALTVGAVLTGMLASVTVYVVVFPLVEVPVRPDAPYVYTALVVASLALVGPMTASIMRGRPAL